MTINSIMRASTLAIFLGAVAAVTGCTMVPAQQAAAPVTTGVYSGPAAQAELDATMTNGHGE